MAASSIPAAKAALLSLLQAQPALAAAHVAWGLPAELPDDRERVYLADAQNIEREWAALRSIDPAMLERYTLRIIVENDMADSTAREAEERLWELVAAVEAAVRGDLMFGGLLRLPAQPAPGAQDIGPTANGWVARCEVRVTCEARI